MPALMLPRWRGCRRFCSVADLDLFERTHLDCDGVHQHAQGHAGFVVIGAGKPSRDPFAADVSVFRGRSDSLIKALWHDKIGCRSNPSD